MPRGRLRRAQPADLPALVAMEECFPSDRLTREHLRHLMASGSARVWAWERDGSVIASAVVLYRAGSRRARLYSLVTHPAFRGRGIGRRMLNAVENHSRGRGCRQVSLEVRVGSGARRLYERCGYHTIARLPGFYEDGRDAWRMEKPLRRLRLQSLARAA